MCVQGNQSLPWITTLLGQLASNELRQLSLCIRADNMQDLRALDAECGVRDIHVVRFDDLMVLDWESLEHSLTMGRLPLLQKIILQCDGQYLAFVSYMRSHYPVLTQLLHPHRVAATR